MLLYISLKLWLFYLVLSEQSLFLNEKVFTDWMNNPTWELVMWLVYRLLACSIIFKNSDRNDAIGGPSDLCNRFFIHPFEWSDNTIYYLSLVAWLDILKCKNDFLLFKDNIPDLSRICIWNANFANTLPPVGQISCSLTAWLC